MYRYENSWLNKVLSVGLVSIVVLAVGFLFYIFPRYNVYSSQLSGQAKLKEAEYTRRTRVLEAQAKADSARLEGEAIIKRAEAQAKANKVISDSLTPEVLQYQFLEVLQENGGDGDETFIYIPVNPSNGVPIGLPQTEAVRFQQKSK